MEWIKWLSIIFFGTMLALLVYSVVSTTITIRKKFSRWSMLSLMFFTIKSFASGPLPNEMILVREAGLK